MSPLLLACVMAAQPASPVRAAATPEQVRERVGIYIWGHVPALSRAVDDARKLGADRVVRAFIGPWSDTPPFADDLRPLAAKLADASYQKLFNNFHVIMLTVYDSYSYSAEYGTKQAVTESPGQARPARTPGRPNPRKIERPSLGVAEHLARMADRESKEYLQRVRREFAEFAFALAQHDRTFILSNWEAENDVPDAGYWPWFQRYLQARLNGILDGRLRARRAGRPGRIFTAFEFTIVPGFAGRNSGLELLGKNLRGLDYLSYSAWWSMGSEYGPEELRASFREAIRRIRALGEAGHVPRRIIIGEFGEYWNQHPSAERLRAIVEVSLEENVEYLFNWVLYDQPGEKDEYGRDASHFGKYLPGGALTPQGRAMRRWFGAAQ